MGVHVAGARKCARKHHLHRRRGWLPCNAFRAAAQVCYACAVSTADITACLLCFCCDAAAGAMSSGLHWSMALRCGNSMWLPQSAVAA